MGSLRILWWAAAFVWVLAACSNGPAGPEPCPAGAARGDDGACLGPCDRLDCGNGSCDEAVGLCVCEAGYTGPGCDTCDTGFQDHDGDGVCLPGCGAVECVRGSCDDTSGVASCLCPAGYAGPGCDVCAKGFQDNDDDGICLPDCNTSDLNCGSQGRCTDVGGEAVCVCRPGHEGGACATCIEGYQDHDGDGICLPTCDALGLSCGHGRCDDASGMVSCSCDEGHVGVACEECAPGYQRLGGDGICRPACGGPFGPVCENGVCEDATGFASCVCDEGYAGDLCELCADGYRSREDGTCQIACVPGMCGDRGRCDDSHGYLICRCDEGYTGPTCGECASGYQDNDRDGVCTRSCANFFGCENSLCSDLSGERRCIPFPRSCRDYQQEAAFPSDGTYSLFFVERFVSFPVICADMDGEPKEYLALQIRKRNRGEYVEEGDSAWMTTHYRNLRFDPFTLRIKVDDPRFSTHESHEMDGFVRLGTAITCDANTEPAVASIDLTDTPFRIVDTHFCQVGEAPRGAVTIRDDRQGVEIVAGGSVGQCSGIVVSRDPTCSNPLESDGWDIQLELR